MLTALSSFTLLRTIESCEREGDKHAFISFDYGNDDWRALADFCFGFLGPKLAHEFGDQVWLSVNVTGVGLIQGELLVRKPMIERVAKFIQNMNNEPSSPSYKAL